MPGLASKGAALQEGRCRASRQNPSGPQTPGAGPALQYAMPFSRKNIRLSRQNYLGHGIYFVTICCHDRKKHFSDHALGFWVLDHLRQQAKQSSFVLHAYCVMPDHVHFLAEGRSPRADLLRFVAGFKRHTALAFLKRAAGALWQGRYYDHVLRSSEEVPRIAGYIWANPVRRHLCEEANTYPLSGSETMEWRRLCATMSDWMPPWKSSGVSPTPRL